MGFPRWRVAAVAVAVPAVLAGSTLTATAASAATTPSQSQVMQQQRLQPQFFTIVFGTSGAGVVTAYGPVFGHGTDNEVSGTMGVFTFRAGSVNVHHTDVSNVPPKINLRACTATVFASGSWQFHGGTGKYRHASGYGHFKFFEVAKLARDRHGKCSANPNQQPVSSYGKVIASGKATIGKH